MNNYLFIENTGFNLNKSLDTTNIFLNEIKILFKDSPLFLLDGKAYREFFTNNLINTIINEEPYFRNDLYLFNLKQFTNSIKKC